MQKGISPVVATIMLLLIAVSLVGFAFLFFSRSVESSSKAGEEQLEQQISQTGIIFDIEYTDKNKIYIRNQGMVNISNLTFYVNNVAIDSAVPAIPPGTVGIVTLNDSQLAMTGSSGPVEIRATLASFSDKITADLYEKYTAAYWKFDEGSGVQVSGSHIGNYSGETFNDGMLVNGPQHVAGKFGNALQFDGVDDYVDAGSDASLKPARQVTLEFWINPSGPPPDEQDWHQVGFRQGEGYSFWGYTPGSGPSQGIFQQWRWAVQTVAGTSIMDLGQEGFLPYSAWTHVAFTYDADAGTPMKAYKNGILFDTTIDFGPAPSGNIIYNGNLWIGKLIPSTIDEVRIYNRALTGEEINESMDSAYPAVRPVASYRFEEGSGNQAKDTHIWVKGKYGAALSFDGVNDYVTVAGGNQPLNITNAITLEAWIYRRSTGARHEIVGRQGSQPYSMEIAANDVIRADVWTNIGQQAATGNTDLSTDTWHHVAFSYDASTTIWRIYVNGVVDSSGTFSGSSINSTQYFNNPLFIGIESVGSLPFNGTIDEVRILNIARPMG